MAEMKIAKSKHRLICPADLQKLTSEQIAKMPSKVELVFNPRLGKEVLVVYLNDREFKSRNGSLLPICPLYPFHCEHVRRCAKTNGTCIWDSDYELMSSLL